MKDYTIIKNEVITDIRISDGAYRLYVLLKSMCYGEKNSCYPSQKFLAKKMERTERTIQRYLNELEETGYIKKKRRGSISNLYYLLKKKVQQTVQNIKDKVKSRENGSKEEKTTNTSFKQSLSNSYRKNYYNNKPVKKDKFNDFEQRDYDFNALEKLLFEGKGNLSDCQK